MLVELLGDFHILEARANHGASQRLAFKWTFRCGSGKLVIFQSVIKIVDAGIPTRMTPTFPYVASFRKQTLSDKLLYH